MLVDGMEDSIMESLYELGAVEALDLEQAMCMGPSGLAQDLA